jgi:hypothetical protein
VDAAELGDLRRRLDAELSALLKVLDRRCVDPTRLLLESEREPVVHVISAPRPSPGRGDAATQGDPAKSRGRAPASRPNVSFKEVADPGQLQTHPRPRRPMLAPSAAPRPDAAVLPPARANVLRKFVRLVVSALKGLLGRS